MAKKGLIGGRFPASGTSRAAGVGVSFEEGAFVKRGGGVLGVKRRNWFLGEADETQFLILTGICETALSFGIAEFDWALEILSQHPLNMERSCLVPIRDKPLLLGCLQIEGNLW